MNLSSTSGSRLPIFFSIDSKVFVAACKELNRILCEKWGHSIIFDIQFSHFSHVRQCFHIRKMSCAEFYFISRKKHAGVYEKRYSMESFVSVILRMFVYFHYDNQQICSHFLPFPIIPGSQYRWNKTWKKYI